MIKKHSLLLALLVCSFFSISSDGLADSVTGGDDCFSIAWPHEQSSLQPDPQIRFGRLNNGFRYIIKVHHQPRGRTALYLGVRTGSIYERSKEQGIAHFLEHMMFNGSEHFQPGRLIDYFQSIGMSFGGDTNALTSYDQTIYKIILPASAQSDLEQGLLVMRDFAGRALLASAEIDRERSVILAEKTSRDSPAYRAMVAENGFTWRGTILADRMPIGKPEVIEQVDRTALKAFYDRWYRPENMTLVMVGDVDAGVAEELMHAYFASFQSAGSAPDCPDYGTLAHKPLEAFTFFDQELGDTKVALEVVTPITPQHDSKDVITLQVRRQLIAEMVNSRLMQIMETENHAFTAGRYYRSDLFDRFRLTGIGAVVADHGWRESLKAIDQLIKQVRAFGFGNDELERAKLRVLAFLRETEETSETTPSPVLARSYLASVFADRVVQSAAQKRELLQPIIAATQLEQADELFRQDWASGSLLVKVIGVQAPQGSEADQMLLAYYQSLQNEPVTQTAQKEAAVIPYRSVPETGSPEEVDQVSEIGVFRYHFPGGLTVLVKPTDFDKHRVSVAIHFGSGRAGLPRPGLELFAEAVVNDSGSGRYTASQMRKALAGSSVDYAFSVGEESFIWQGRALAEEAETLFAVLSTVLFDPGFRQEPFVLAQERFKQLDNKLLSDAEGAVMSRLVPFFSGNTPGFGFPGWQTLSTISLTELEHWLRPAFQGAGLEISVVGDIDPQVISGLASRYFGGRALLPEGSPIKHDPVFPAGKTCRVSVPTTVDKAVVRIAWLTNDFWDIARTRRLHVLASVFEDRLRSAVRETIGASYSPTVTSDTSRSYQGFGVIVAQVVTESSMVELVQKEIESVAASLISRPVTEDELNRAKRPIDTQLKQSVRSNGYWLQSVLSLSSRHPEQLAWPVTMIDDYGSVTVNDIVDLAGRYLLDSRQATGIVMPAGR